jgi:hypothetical protein
MRYRTVLLLVVAGLLNATQGWAVDLPKMSFVNENKLLKAFPLEKATKKDVIGAYGPPDKTVTGLPDQGEAWTYGHGAEGKTFTFMFRGETVYDVEVRYPNRIYKPRTARKKQGLQ